MIQLTRRVPGNSSKSYSMHIWQVQRGRCGGAGAGGRGGRGAGAGGQGDGGRGAGAEGQGVQVCAWGR